MIYSQLIHLNVDGTSCNSNIVDARFLYLAASQKWAGFENRMKAKREVNGKRKLKHQTPQKVDQLTVQRLSSGDLSSRIGPREFVSYPYGDLTIEGIKKACEAHFLSQIKMHAECDVLAGEQGPSCSNLGKVVRQKTTAAEIFKFNLEDMT